MSWTFVGTGRNGIAGSGTTITASIVGVHVGDVIVAATKWESTNTTVAVSDGTTSLTETTAAHRLRNAGSITTHYLLSSAVSGTVTYTATFGVAMTFKDFGVMAFTPTANSTVTVDGTPVSSAASGSANLATQNITTTGTDGMGFADYGETGASISATKINGVAAQQDLTFGGAPNSRLWAASYISGFTGNATATTASSWVADFICFTATANATPATAKNLPLTGIGQ